MLAAIDFEYQCRLCAEKVSDVWPDRDLAAELGSSQPSVPQREPYFPLCVRLSASQADSV